MRVWAPVCVCANIRVCFLSLVMTVFIPDLAQFAAIVSIYSHFLKSKVLNGQAFFLPSGYLLEPGWVAREAEIPELGMVEDQSQECKKSILSSEMDSREVRRENLLEHSFLPPPFIKALA